MRMMNHFVVELDKTLHDTITTDSGMEFYVDNRFNEFEHRVVEGPVKATPRKHDLPVRPGDTLYFHHLVVLQEGQKLTGSDKDYMVLYDPDVCVANQAIAYKDQDTGEVRSLGQWCLLEAVDQEDELVSEILEIIDNKEKLPTEGRVWCGNDHTTQLGVKVGDVVGFRKNMDYRIMIDGEEKYRVDSDDLLYVHND
jgi:co-chaperonin GroES (HSP10)